MGALTSRLKLYKPGGGSTGTIVPDETADIDKINSDLDLIDAAVGAPRFGSTTRPASPFDGQLIAETDTGALAYWDAGAAIWRYPNPVITIADLDALAALTAGSFEGRRFHVDSMNVDFEAIDGVWVQQGVSVFPDTTTRDAEYTKASTAYKIANVRSRVTSEPYERFYSTASSSWKVSSNLLVGAGLVPLKPSGVSGTTVALGADGTVSFTAATTVAIDGILSADFDEVLLRFKALTSAGGTVATLRLRTVGSGDDTNAVYDSTAAASATSFTLLSTNAAAQRMSGEVTVVSGNLAEPTQFRSDVSGHIPSTGAAKREWSGGAHRNTTQFTGVSVIFSAGTVGGYVRAFGYNNE